jgi:hypothetical protein
VSVEAISWALNLAPVPADRGGQPSSACRFVFVGLANHAGPNGTAAFLSVPCPPTEIRAKRRLFAFSRCVDLDAVSAQIAQYGPGTETCCWPVRRLYRRRWARRPKSMSDDLP